MLTDTHFHLDLFENMTSMIQQLKDSDVRVLAVGTTSLAYKRELAFVQGNPNIKVGLGYHPQLIAERPNEIELILKQIKDSRFIGEIGLDFNSGYYSFKDKQVSVFRNIVMECSKQGGKVLSIHSVKAAGAVLDELEAAEAFHSCMCILHWFTGSAKERKRAIADGAYFSVNPRMLGTKSGIQNILAFPANRILLETDAPFTRKYQSVGALGTELEELVKGIEDIRKERLHDQIEMNSEKIWN